MCSKILLFKYKNIQSIIQSILTDSVRRGVIIFSYQVKNVFIKEI